MAYTLSLALHEACHAAAARSLGLSLGRIEVLPFGGRAEILGLEARGPAAEAAVAIAGPIANVVVLALAAALMRFGGFDADRLRLLVDANLAILGVNLLPAFPLDGGRVLRAVLWTRYGFSDATRGALHIARILAAALLPVGAVLQLAGYPGWQAAVLGGLILLAARSEQRQAGIQRYALWLRALDDLRQGHAVPVQVLAVSPESRLRVILRHLFGRAAHEVILYDRELARVGRLSDGDLYRALERGELDRSLGEIARPKDG